MGAGCTLAGRGAACCCCWLGAEQIAFFQTLFKSAQRIQARRVVVAVLLLVALLVALPRAGRRHPALHSYAESVPSLSPNLPAPFRL